MLSFNCQFTRVGTFRFYMLAMLGGLALSFADSAAAQAPNAKALDRKAEELQAGFLKELDTLATEYEEAGLFDRAKQTLRKRQGILRSEEVKARLDALEERDFETNQKELKIDPNRGWTDTGLDVEEGQPVRIEAKGKIRHMINVEVGPEGLPLADGVGNVPMGSLIAVVFPPAEGKKRPEPTEPVVVAGQSQFEPAKSGRLFLRVAGATGAKLLGDFEVRVSGKIAPASRTR